MRQRGQLQRHPERGEFRFDELAPAPRPTQAFAKAVGQALLKPDASGRGAKLVIADVIGPQRQYTRLFGAQAFALAVGQALQHPDQGVAALLDAPVALLAADTLGHVDALVDHREVAIVVQYALVRSVPGEYRHPEIDVPP